MNLFPVIFRRQQLKQVYYAFLAAIIVLFLGSLAAGVLLDLSGRGNFKTGISSWLFFLLLLVITLALGRYQSKLLKSLREKEANEYLFDAYLEFYRKRAISNVIPFLLTCILWVSGQLNIYFYILLGQLIVAFMMFPSVKAIERDLPGVDIIYE